MVRHACFASLLLSLSLACSSPSNQTPGTGGSANGGSAQGGSANPSGGTTSQNGGTTAQGGATSGVGGSAQQGGSANGGSNNGGSSNGGSSSGGSTSGGSSNGGSSSSGGTSNGGSSNGGSTSGGSSNGGSSSSGWRAAVATQVTDQMLSDGYSAWKAKYTQVCNNGSNSAVVVKDGSVVSEGIAYGMLLSANMNNRTLFDGLYKYYMDHLDPNGLMNWATGLCDAPGNNNANAATDGDLDAVMALIQAHARWSDGGYLDKAKALAAKILQFEVEDCSGRKILRPGDKFGGCSDTSNQKINPSYFAPGYYRVFAHYFSEQAASWNALTTGTYELFPIMQTRMSGLVPDWAKYDGSDWYGSGYSWDACRTPWRVMIDYAWSGDAKAQTFMQNVRTWVDTNGTGSMPKNSAFLGAFALAAAYDKAKFDAAVSSWLGAGGDDGPYFQATLRLLYLLAAAGRFPSTM
ncbi:MAG: glycosyl hydrolase family 8 [Polyangiaceae bacterium]